MIDKSLPPLQRLPDPHLQAPPFVDRSPSNVLFDPDTGRVSCWFDPLGFN